MTQTVLNTFIDSFLVRWANCFGLILLTVGLVKEFQWDVAAAAVALLVGLVAQEWRLFQKLNAPKTYLKHDRQVFLNLVNQLPSLGSIEFLRDHDFGNGFHLFELNQLDNFNGSSSDQGGEFLDAEMEKRRKQLAHSCMEMSRLIGRKTYPYAQGGLQGVPFEWSETWKYKDDPEMGAQFAARYEEHVKTLNETARKVAQDYDSLLKYVKPRLFSDDIT